MTPRRDAMAAQSVLLVYLSEGFSDAHVSELRVVVESVASSRRWTLSAPDFIDETDSSACTRPEDEPIRPVGAVLAVSKPDEPHATSRAEATAFIEAMAAFSKEHDVEMEVQLDNTYAGTIRAGVPDRLVREGLLAAWCPRAARPRFRTELGFSCEPSRQVPQWSSCGSRARTIA